MILTAHQPVYLPWLGLFHKIALADRFISFNQVQYQPKEWNNRNQIKTRTGPLMLTVPVLRKGYLEKKIDEIEINNKEPWQRKHLRSIQIAYAGAPYIGKYLPILEDIYTRKWHRLVELNEYMLVVFLDLLGIRTTISSAADWNFEGSKSDLVLDMCNQVGATHYIFGSQGVNYAEKEKFQMKGIKIEFQQYKHPVYKQMHGDFSPNMSVLDLLLNCGDESYEILMSKNVKSINY